MKKSVSNGFDIQTTKVSGAVAELVSRGRIRWFDSTYRNGKGGGHMVPEGARATPPPRYSSGNSALNLVA